MVEAIETRSIVGQTYEASPHSWERAPARIKVVGIGGGGCNCVRRMLQNRIPGVRFVMVNTDIKSLESTVNGADLVQIGPKLTHGWGAGGDSRVGERAAEESEKEIRDSIKNAELVFVTTGMGGGTGTGAAPYVASVAKDMGALVVGVVTTPFSFEGNRRIGQAMAGVERLRPFLDNLIVIHNDRLLKYVSHDAEMMDAFRTADEVVTQGILSVSELINVPGEINVDFADVRTVMGIPGSALMAIGRGNGKLGVVDAARQAMANPLLNMSIKGAHGVLFSVKGGSNLSLGGVNAAGELISSTVRKNAAVFFGMSIDDELEDSVKLTLIATGLKDSKPQGGRGFGFMRRG
ncbi:MAG: cell division protein FtsZ [Chloroflexota bacterium]|nr:cell division protein FtsZ [Chloroflexota bacterium]MDE2941409.1 cell division protein FtsZ [Chloroflexota bacterium]MDE3268597.1 cell division protein FtsZ [Chloroflexota bacterium]